MIAPDRRAPTSARASRSQVRPPAVNTSSSPTGAPNAIQDAPHNLAATVELGGNADSRALLSNLVRALPASSTFSADGWSRRAAISSSPASSAFDSSTRVLGLPSAPVASAVTTFS